MILKFRLHRFNFDSLAPCWAMLASSWLVLGHPGAILWSSWAFWGPSWPLLGSSWGHPGPILGHVMPILGLSWAFLGASWPVFGLSGSSFCSSSPILRHLGRSCRHLRPTWAYLGRPGGHVTINNHCFSLCFFARFCLKWFSSLQLRLSCALVFIFTFLVSLRRFKDTRRHSLTLARFPFPC